MELTVTGREAVLAALRAAGRPVSAAELATTLGLHPNTVRGHLELLAQTGAATRAVETRTTRGRPRVMYQARPERSDGLVESYRTLATALAMELAQVAAVDQAMADAAGRMWAQSLVRSGRLVPTDDPEVAVAQVVALFDELGFDPATEPLGDRLYLRRCPYAEQVEQFPGICDLHLGLLRAAFSETGDRVAVPGMVINARPGLCVAHLERKEGGR